MRMKMNMWNKKKKMKMKKRTCQQGRQAVADRQWNIQEVGSSTGEE